MRSENLNREYRDKNIKHSIGFENELVTQSFKKLFTIDEAIFVLNNGISKDHVTEKTINTIIEKIHYSDQLIQFRTGCSISGHTFLLYRDPNDNYKIISLMQYDQKIIDAMKQAYWFQYLKNKLSPKNDIEFITKNRQNDNISLETLLSLNKTSELIFFDTETNLKEGCDNYLSPLFIDTQSREIHQERAHIVNCDDLRASKKDDSQKSQRYISKCDKVYIESSAYENLYEFKDDTKYKYAIRDFRKKGGNLQAQI